ncbi:MAG: energy transducer TonB, partial [Candidatus Obscuribacterales bacterium]|nr:energy transducer TonB [Candidatus Obscuribacterales bacterium]
ASADPDMDDQELMVEWDKWRNRFLWTVQSGLTANMNDPDKLQGVWDPMRQAMVMMPRFPLGITAWFSCTVTKKRKIENLKLEHTSGYPAYDQAVLDAVRSMEGTSILKFPGRSRRLTVRQMAGIKTSTTGERQFFKFGDVERYRSQP